MKIKKKTAVICCVCLTAMLTLNAYAKPSQEDVSNAKKEAAKKQEQLDDAKEKVEELESSKAKLEGSLAALNTKLEKLSNEMTELENSAAQKEAEINATQIELEAALLLEQEQYESMKLRIKYLYELGGESSMLQMIIEEKDFAEILNKADYYSKITSYDRQMLDELQNTKNQIAQAKQVLEQDKADIDNIIAQKETKQQEIQSLIGDTMDEIASQTEDIEAAQAKALEYEKELDKKNETLENLQAQLELRDSLKNETASVQNRQPSGGSNYNISSSKAGYSQASSSSDLDVMAAIIYCEAGAEPYYGQLAVGSVIMNRIHSGGFPNTLLGVLYQKSQFSPVMSGRFAVVLSKKLATDSCYQAASEVLNGTNVVPDCLFFRTVIKGIDGQIIGNHVFY